MRGLNQNSYVNKKQYIGRLYLSKKTHMSNPKPNFFFHSNLDNSINYEIFL